MLGAGKRKELILIKRDGIPVSDGMGGHSDPPEVTVLQTFADIKQMKATAELIAQHPDMIGLQEFKILYRQDIEIKNTDWIEWRGRIFEIVGLQPDFIFKKNIVILGKTSNKTTLNNV